MKPERHLDLYDIMCDLRVSWEKARAIAEQCGMIRDGMTIRINAALYEQWLCNQDGTYDEMGPITGVPRFVDANFIMKDLRVGRQKALYLMRKISDATKVVRHSKIIRIRYSKYDAWKQSLQGQNAYSMRLHRGGIA